MAGPHRSFAFPAGFFGSLTRRSMSASSGDIFHPPDNTAPGDLGDETDFGLWNQLTMPTNMPVSNAMNAAHLPVWHEFGAAEHEASCIV